MLGKKHQEISGCATASSLIHEAEGAERNGGGMTKQEERRIHSSGQTFCVFRSQRSLGTLQFLPADDFLFYRILVYKQKRPFFLQGCRDTATCCRTSAQHNTTQGAIDREGDRQPGPGRPQFDSHEIPIMALYLVHLKEKFGLFVLKQQLAGLRNFWPF